MKVLVATAAYPSVDGARPQYFVHSRNLYYKKAGIDVTVLNFATYNDYDIEGINVISLSTYEQQNGVYDILICHAANLRNHYRFIKKYGKNFTKKVFFFHGHEMLHIRKYYPEPYSFVKKKKSPKILQDMYDSLKIRVWKKYFLNNIHDTWLIFVSDWIYKQVLQETKIDEKAIINHSIVINNSVGEFFEKNRYKPEVIKYDFITIRGNLDGSKYGVDIVIDLAKKYTDYKFCVIGKGNFFNFFPKPRNVTWINTELSHEEMANYINSSKIALLPTREDTQGLMACEMATYGIPLITSDIDVCKEIFSECPLCTMISNDSPDLESALEIIGRMDTNIIWDEYFAKNTIDKEIKYLINIHSVK